MPDRHDAVLNPDPEAYRPIPVDEARRIAGTYLKDWVIILAYDGEFERTHSTTFAGGTGTKFLAADLADVCLKAIGVATGPLNGGIKSYEDFRLRPEAEAAKEIADLKTEVERLTARLAEMEGQLDV
jgi:hypothetical protein